MVEVFKSPKKESAQPHKVVPSTHFEEDSCGLGYAVLFLVVLVKEDGAVVLLLEYFLLLANFALYLLPKVLHSIRLSNIVEVGLGIRAHPGIFLQLRVVVGEPVVEGALPTSWVRE